MVAVQTNVSQLITPTQLHQQSFQIPGISSTKLCWGFIKIHEKFITNYKFRLGDDKHPPLNKMFIKEYETYIKDIFGSDSTILGPPASKNDPRPDYFSCLEKTIRNKISKMTYLHIYFKVIFVLSNSLNPYVIIILNPTSRTLSNASWAVGGGGVLCLPLLNWP